jgi:RNA polymerase sigma-70 factor, ECF subfamily
VRGAETWARGAISAARGARLAPPALVNGGVGLVVEPRGRLFRMLSFTFSGGRIAADQVIGNTARLAELELAVLDNR